MKTCSFCQTDNMDDAKYCKECGKVLAQPPTDLSEREILLQVRDLLDKGVKRSEDYQRENHQYIEGIVQREEEARRENRRIILLFVCLLIVYIVVSLVLSALD